MEFPNGLIVKRNENAPDYILCKLSVKKSEFIEWLNSRNGEWENLEICVSKGGKPYAKVDDWKPDQNKNQYNQDVPDSRNGHSGYEDIPPSDEDLPF